MNLRTDEISVRLKEAHLNRGGGRNIFGFDRTGRHRFRWPFLRVGHHSIFRLQMLKFAQLGNTQCFGGLKFVTLQIVALEHDLLDRVLDVTERKLRVLMLPLRPSP
jgi:hypothetical protein